MMVNAITTDIVWEPNCATLRKEVEGRLNKFSNGRLSQPAKAKEAIVIPNWVAANKYQGW